MARALKTTQVQRWTVPWLDLVLPIYALTLVVIYYRADSFSLPLEDEWAESIVWWAVWIVGGALGGLLALSGLSLIFYLLYSPFYLVNNFQRAIIPGVWIDPGEFRFYLFCFLLLCILIGLAVWNLEVFLVTFAMLAGSAQLLWRLLV